MSEREPVVHQCPAVGQDGEPGSPTLPCCGRWVHEMVFSADKITSDPDLVTCKKESADA